MKPPRRKVVSGKQFGSSLSGYNDEWTLTLVCGHIVKYNIMYKNVPMPKTTGCYPCLKEIKA